MNKRTFALLICLVLIFGLLPVTAYAAATIDQVDIMITHPVHLGEPDFYVQVYGTGCKLDTDVDTDGHQDGVRWRKIATGAIVTSGMTFTGGELYELSVCLVADDGYAFSADQTKITVNLDEASFTLEDARHIRMTIQLTADNLYVNYVTVTGLDAPQAGNTADHSVTVQENTCQLTSSGYDTCKNGVTWYDATDSAYCPVGATFQGGHEYWAEIHLRANPGYVFPYDAQGYVDGTWVEAGGGGAAIVLNYFMIGVTVQRALDKEEKEAKQTIKTSASLRTLYLFLVALLGVLVDVFAIIPLLLCFFFPRLAIMIRPLVDRRAAKKEANSDEE